MSKPRVLHLGAPIKYNPTIYTRISQKFDIIQPQPSELPREEFKRALKERRWGDFDAVFRPFWNTGGEMGNWDEELIGLLPGSVRVMASAGAGYDWVDVKGLAKRGIIYCNGAAASSDSVSDMALFLILSVFRNLRWSHSAAHSANPVSFLDAHKNSPLSAYNPRSRTLGIIGLGQIGYQIALKAHNAFGMKILYHDILRKSPEMEGSIEAVFYDTLDKMLGESDCVIVATPFAGETLMTEGRFRAFKRGSRFVNVARGSLVDEEALVKVLDEGVLSAAGLDVHASEPNVHPRLAGHPRVMMMSHNAGGTVDTHVGFERLAMENVEAFLETGKALTPVNAHLVEKQIRSVL
ncbi:putative D-mandelate dehydrogenase [Aspergillus steynii IBT 23096]|uniref:Putative D-mandelate dehydrogenase n=1 Tax=Aspergillus steynii IBT 23096 TaxID=1392250 RepID=A0A2I2FRT5_9EURO|nr:putative D-mandelate dehydrogenase [Aspergillus steynii IBT 23096]PLB43345.1 putative D-mandelate dehydrogenase [Aspergillus steynii IBT 23096]